MTGKNMKYLTSLRIKIAAGILFSLITVLTFEPALFVADTPTPNPHIMADLGLIPARYMANIRNPFDHDKARSEIETIKIGRSAPPATELRYTPVTSGVYAAERATTGEQYVKLDKGTKVQVYIMRLSEGKIVKVYVPVVEK